MPLLCRTVPFILDVMQVVGLGAFAGTACMSVLGCGANSIASVIQPASTPVTTPTAVKTGPQLGYLWSDKNQTLNPVLGVPGSSQVGQSVVPANLYVGAAASAYSSIALLQESDGSFDVMSLPSGTPTRVAATLAPGAQMRFAPSGAAAIAFAPGASSVILFTGLGTIPQAHFIAFGAALSEATVSDAGSIAGALRQASGIVVRAISATGAATTVANTGGMGGMSFVGTSDDLLLADSVANSLTLIRNSTSSPSPSVLASEDLLHAPLGVQATRDGHWAILANTGDANVIRIDITSAITPQSFACACKPSLVAPLSGTGVFRITGVDNGPAWMFDAAAATPRVLFIPANPLTAEASTGQQIGMN